MRYATGMDDKLKFDAVNYDTYKNAKSTRPAWANALIVALVVFIAGIPAWFTGGLNMAVWFFLAAGVAALIAGALALMNVGRRA